MTDVPRHDRLPDRSISRRPSARSTSAWRRAAPSTPSADASRAAASREPYTIVMPPPNVTAVLHMGHGLEQHGPGRAHPLGAHGGRRSAVGARHRPRRHRHAERRREAAREGRTKRATTSAAKRSWSAPKQFVDETGGVILQQLERSARRADWYAHGVHALARAVARRARSVRAPVRARPDLSRPSRHPLVSALPHVAQSDEEAESTRRRASCTTSLSAESDEPDAVAIVGRDDASGDDARRRGRGRESGRRALSRSRRKHVLLPIVDIEIPDRRRRATPIRRSAPAR